MPRQALCELPLERFLPPKSAFDNPLKHASKRTLSPIPPTLYSPAKRRILCQEGVFSPEKTMKDPISGRTRLRLAKALHGPNSPAKKLDFGETMTPKGKRTDDDRLPYLLAPSPELTPKANRKSPPSPISPLIQVDSDEEIVIKTSTRCQLVVSSPILVPREPPSQPDRQSTHYPGFDIYQDPHIVFFRTKSVSPGPASSTIEPELEDKENMPPRLTARRLAAFSGAEGKSHVLCSLPKNKMVLEEDRLKSSFMPFSKPHFGVANCDPDVLQTPHRSRTISDVGFEMRLALSSFDLHSPGRTPAGTRLQRREARRRLIDEADGSGADDDEEFDPFL